MTGQTDSHKKAEMSERGFLLVVRWNPEMAFPNPVKLSYYTIPVLSLPVTEEVWLLLLVAFSS